MRLYRPPYTDKRTGKKKHARVWWVYARVNGKTFRQSLGVRDKEVARRKAMDLIQREEYLASGVPVYLAAKTPLLDLVEEYRAELLRLGRAEYHADTQTMFLRRLFEHVPTLTEATPEVIRLRLASLEEIVGKSFHGKTINKHRGAAMSFFNWLIREGRWNSNPAKAVRRVYEGDPVLPRSYFTLPELRLLVEAAPKVRGTVYLFTATTGLRRGELKVLEWKHIDFERCWLSVSKDLAKGRKEIELPLLPEVVETLAALRKDPKADPTYVFRYGNKCAIPINRTLYADMAKAGLGKLSKEGKRDFHALRDSTATILAEAGVPLTVTQAILRHSTPVLTAKHYVRHSQDTRAEAVSQAFGGLCKLLAAPGKTDRDFWGLVETKEADYGVRPVAILYPPNGSPQAIYGNGPTGIRTQNQAIMSRQNLRCNHKRCEGLTFNSEADHASYLHGLLGDEESSNGR